MNEKTTSSLLEDSKRLARFNPWKNGITRFGKVIVYSRTEYRMDHGSVIRVRHFTWGTLEEVGLNE